MAELNASIIARASAVAGEVPQASELEVAELSVNTADARLFTKHTDNSVKEIGGSSLPSFGPAGDVLASDGQSWVSADLSALLTGGASATPEILLNFESDGEDYPALSSTGMTTAYPSIDSKFGSGAASFVRSNQDFLQGIWPQSVSTNPWTFSFWINTSDTDYSSSIGKRLIAPVSGTNLADGFQILKEPTGGASFSPHADNAQGALMLNPGGTAGAYLCSTRIFSPDDGLWHYVVFQHEGNGVYSCFYDGSLTERRTAAAAINFAANGGFFIGKRQDDNSAAYFSGTIDGLSFTLDHVESLTSSVQVPSTPPSTPASLGSGASIGDLADVATSIPADGQVLTWVDANSQWEPAQLSGGGSVDSVNGETGVVSLGIQDMDDFELLPDPSSAYHDQKQSDGDWSSTNSTEGGFALDQAPNYTKIYIRKSAPTSGLSLADQGFTAGTTLDLWVGIDGVNFTKHTATNSSDQASDNATFTGLTPGLSTYSGNAALYFRLSDPLAGLPLADGDILHWVDAESKFKPTQLPGQGAVTSWSVTANGTSDYVFAGDGFAGTETDPILYVVRGQTYEITNSTGAHPFQIQSTAGAGGTVYGDGITNNAVSDGTLTWEVRLDAPAKLYYQCTVHANMGGTIQVLENVDTSASNLRSLLGIGEYVDDAAAGADGVTSGAMYYNTTSSDYRLKS